MLQIPEEGEEFDDDELVTCQVVLPLCMPSAQQGQRVVLVGSSPLLGKWRPENGVCLERCGDDEDMWVGRVRLPVGRRFEAKLVVWGGGGAGRWEPGGNRCISLPEELRPAPPPVAVPGEAGSSDELSSELSGGLDGSDSSALISGPLADESLAEAVQSSSDPAPLPSSAAVVMKMDREAISAVMIVHWGLPDFVQLIKAGAFAPLSFSNSRILTSSSSLCRFVVPHFPTVLGQHLLLVGSAPELGR